MAYAMTKQGSLDNCITYEFICDTTADMNAIENRYRTIGTVAIVLQGESGGLEVFIASSNKQWNSLSAVGSSSESGAGAGLSIHICAQNEVSSGLPSISEPDESTIYLVASGSESGNLYEEYIYVNSAWEKFGAASIDLSGYALPSVISSDNDKVLQVANGEWGVGTKKIDKEYATGFSSTWSEKTWSGLTEVYGGSIWSDGDNVYYSDGSDQYVLNKSTSTWATKTWIGLTEFYRESIWTDGENIYYSDDTDQYVLDKSTSTWSVKNWNDLPEYFSGSQVWTDGENIYYSAGSDQYILDKSTSTWSAKTWTGFTNIHGSGVWTDGENIYYSSGSSQYVLDKSTSTWSAKTWIGLTEFYRQNIWTDDNNIYFSADSSQYVLDKSTSTWIVKTWTELIDFTGADVWSDGDNIYSAGYNSNGDYGNYVLNKDNSQKLLLGTNGEFSPVSAESLAMSGATASTAGSFGFVPAPAIGDQDKVLKGDGTWGTVSSLPATPVSDGTYTLQATVASGVVTYTWVAGA